MENSRYKYQIQIGQKFDPETQSWSPEIMANITQEQFEIIELLANTKKSSDLTLIYVINDIEFEIVDLVYPTLN